MTAEHHLSDRQKLAYAAGDTPEAFSVLIAAHLEICPTCHLEIRELEAAGGQLLRETAPAARAPDDLLARTLAQLGEVEPPPPRPMTAPDNVLPPALQAYVADLEAAPWKKITQGAERCRLVGKEAGDSPFALLYRLQPGQGIIEHDHTGDELMLILDGGLEDEKADLHYRRGDVIDSTPGHVHRLVVDSDVPCICVIANATPIRATSVIGRLIARWLKL